MNALELRLQEAIAVLETLREQSTLTYADLWQAEQIYDKAVAEAKKRDAQELDQWMFSELCVRSTLQLWHQQQSEAAKAVLARKKTWQHQLVTFMACLLSGGLFLIVEMREIQALQSRRDNPPYGEEQRRWLRNVQDVQRKIASLRSLPGPRPTPEMRKSQQEVFSLRKKKDMLKHQILLQETRVHVLKQQLSI